MSSLNVRTTYHIYYFTLKMSFFVINFFVTLKKHLIVILVRKLVQYDILLGTIFLNISAITL